MQNLNNRDITYSVPLKLLISFLYARAPQSFIFYAD